MKNFIGGLFQDRKDAELALKALLENGIEDSSINILECTHENKAVVLREQPSIQSMGLGALIGAFLGGTLGSILGLLAGVGILPVPGLEPSGGATTSFGITWQFVLSSLATGLIFGLVIGILLGAVVGLALARYKKVDTSKGIHKGDVMIAVEADDIRKETKAKLTMKEYGARKFEEFRNTWNTEIWSVSRDKILQTR